MKQTVRNLRWTLRFVIGLTLLLILGLMLQQWLGRTRLAAAPGENKTVLGERYAAAGRVLDRNGEMLAYSQHGRRLYHNNPETATALLHVVGDYTHRVGNTIEALYGGPLTGSGRNPFHQLLLDLSGKGRAGDDITLTIDASLSSAAYQLLGGQRGAVVLMNYITGDVLVSVSTPSVHPQQVVDWVDIPDTALFDRSLTGTYNTGTLFSQVNPTRAAGFGIAFQADRRMVQPSHIETIVEPESASPSMSGRPETHTRLHVSPLQQAMIAAGIANGGSIPEPHFVKYLTDPRTVIYHRQSQGYWRTLPAVSTDSGWAPLPITPASGTTSTTTGVQAYSALIRTDTVQVENKREAALLVGFLPHADAPYALAIVVEEGGDATMAAMPIATALLELALQDNRN